VPTLYRRFNVGKRRRSSSSTKRRIIFSYLYILKELVVYSFAIWGFFDVVRELVMNRHVQVHEIALQTGSRPGCDCGNSIAEAISLGCKFDSLSMAWLPEICRDDELTTEFDTAGDGPNGTWLYFANTEHTIEVDVATVAAMGDDPSARAHMGKTWHMVHCLFYWRKQFRARFNGKIVEPRSDTEVHIKHCGMVFQDPGYGTISGVALNTNEEVVE
jgi:hypothetical protein